MTSSSRSLILALAPTGNVDDIPAFTKNLLAKYPEIDCLINNAGVQRPLDMQSLDLTKVDNEIINIRGPVHLATAFLEQLQDEANGSDDERLERPWLCALSHHQPDILHFWSMTQPVQLRDTSIRIVEIVPPSVGTDLHRERSNPDDNKKHLGAANSLTIEEFIDEFQKGIEKDCDTISAGSGIALVEKWDKTFGKQFDKVANDYRRE